MVVAAELTARELTDDYEVIVVNDRQPRLDGAGAGGTDRVYPACVS